ncbi:MAG: sigma 54-interacting transcriptional regulator, partial [Calditrichota bacterium]
TLYHYHSTAPFKPGGFQAESSDVTKTLREDHNVQEWLSWRSGEAAFIFLVHQNIEPVKADTLWNLLFGGSEAALLSSEVLQNESAVENFLGFVTGSINEKSGLANLEALQESYQKAMSNEQTGPVLHYLFQRGILLYEKIRQEIDFFQLAVDTESAIVELSRKVISLGNRSKIAAIGMNEALLAILKHFKKQGIGQYQVFFNQNTSLELPPFLKITAFDSFPQDNPYDVILIAPSDKDKISDEQLTSWARSRNKPLLVFDISKTNRHMRSLRRYGMLYFYSEKDIAAVINSNLEGRKQTHREIKRWIKRERESFYGWLGSEERYEFAGIVGSTSAMQQVFELISRIARTDITVLVDGESGTGKERVARAIHMLSGRANNPFQVLNCGAIPENLLESELFGHEKGAFTGAIAQKRGLFEEADTGTIFLDEIGELPAQLQVKLLRFLQEGEIKHVGSNETRKVDVRIIAATNQDLNKMVEMNTFRSDLYYRLNVLQLTVPPLRERKNDISLLAEHFRKKFVERLRKPVNSISAEAMQMLEKYTWPGNVRELENAIERGVALALGEQILPVNLPPIVQNPPITKATMQDIPFHGKQLTLKELEKEYILATLEQFDWNYDDVCKKLAIGRTTLWRKLREYNVVPPN